MGIDEFLNIDLEADTTNLDKLDRDSKKAARNLEKQRKALEKAQKQREQSPISGGPSVPGGGRAPGDIARLSKKDEKIRKKLDKITEKIRKDEVKQMGGKSNFLQDLIGKKSAKNIFDMGKSPAKFLTGALKALPFLGGVLAAVEIAKFIVDEIVKIDKFLKVFLDIADERIALNRSLQDQAEIAAGKDQAILTTGSGGLDAREAYNTFVIFNQNQGEIEAKYQLQNVSGV